MNRFLLIFLILVTSSLAFSQKNYFIYLQSENDQPFFVKLGDKIHSSSVSGYLILSKLRDSSYTLSIGFPQNRFPEQRFTVEIKGKDRGFLLKNFGEKGWGLFDLQTLGIQMALPENNSKTKRTVPRDDISPFTEILAKAANDPSLKERPLMVRMEEKPAVVQTAVLKEEVKTIAANSQEEKTKDIIQEKRDSVVGSKTEPVVKNASPLPAKKEQQLIIEIIEPAIGKQAPLVREEEKKSGETIVAYQRSVVTKRSESSTSGGFGLTYIDEYADGRRDTIRIIIPNSRASQEEVKVAAKEDKKFLDISSEDSARTAKNEPINREKTGPIAFANMNCNDFASEDDISKLHKKMAGKKEEEGMIEEAKKVFKTKCLTAEQVKNLSGLFSTDVNRYKFFDAAYAYVSDTENFASLSAELKDEYYIKRFKAMLR